MFKKIIGASTPILGKDVFVLVDVGEDGEVQIVRDFLGTECDGRTERSLFIRKPASGKGFPIISTAKVSDVKKETKEKVVLRLGAEIRVNKIAPHLENPKGKNLDMFHVLDA